MIILIRHGACTQAATLGARPNAELTSDGKEQVRVLSDRLQKWRPRVIYTSPLHRAVQTAEMLGHALGCEIRENSALREMDFGRWDGLTFDVLSKDPLWQKFNAKRSEVRCPGGETMWELQNRIVTFIEKLERNSESVVLVTHAEPIRAALCHYRDIPLDRYFEIEVEPGSFAVLEIENEDRPRS